MTTFIKLPEELKNNWINALRSGQYRQAKRELVEEDFEGEIIGYCCLGVACVVNGSDPFYLINKELITVDLMNEALFNIFNQFYEYTNAKGGRTETLQDYLADMNDNQNKTFTEIAAWVEENL